MMLASVINSICSFERTHKPYTQAKRKPRPKPRPERGVRARARLTITTRQSSISEFTTAPRHPLKLRSLATGDAATALTGKAAGQAISPRLSYSVLPRHHATGEGGRRFADACLSAWPENSRICSNSRPIAFGSSVPFQALFRARLLVGLRRPTHSSAGRRIVRRRRKATPRGAHSSDRRKRRNR
jgi:hypothetical protein